jgi:hypothetical protein
VSCLLKFLSFNILEYWFADSFWLANFKQIGKFFYFYFSFLLLLSTDSTSLWEVLNQDIKFHLEYSSFMDNGSITIHFHQTFPPNFRSWIYAFLCLWVCALHRITINDCQWPSKSWLQVEILLAFLAPGFPTHSEDNRF